MRDLGRHLRLLKTLDGKICRVCNHDASQHLVWFPHHDKIKHYLLRYGKKSKEYKTALNLIDGSIPVCMHCRADRYYMRVTDDEVGLPWPHQ